MTRAESLQRNEDIRAAVANGTGQGIVATMYGLSRQRVGQIVHKAQHAARQAVYRALKNGTLVRPEACTWCFSSGRVEGHHEDYGKPLEVLWLCDGCHQLADEVNKGRLTMVDVRDWLSKQPSVRAHAELSQDVADALGVDPFILVFGPPSSASEVAAEVRRAMEAGEAWPVDPLRILRALENGHAI